MVWFGFVLFGLVWFGLVLVWFGLSISKLVLSLAQLQSQLVFNLDKLIKTVFPDRQVIAVICTVIGPGGLTNISQLGDFLVCSVSININQGFCPTKLTPVEPVEHERGNVGFCIQ